MNAPLVLALVAVVPACRPAPATAPPVRSASTAASTSGPTRTFASRARLGSHRVADGNAYFNRPGPRIVESLEILAACVNLEEFQDFAEKHRGSVVRLGQDFTNVPVG